MPGDVEPAADPNSILRQHVVDESRKSGRARRLAREAAMHRHSHHARCLGTQCVECVKVVLERGEEISGLAPAQAAGQPCVVVVERVRDDEMWSAELVVPIRQLVIVGITVVEESTLVDDQTPCVRAGGADVPPEGTGSSKAADEMASSRRQTPILVEQGFWTLYASMQLIGPTGAALGALAPAITNAAGSTGMVTVVGHSLGAALATYLTLDQSPCHMLLRNARLRGDDTSNNAGPGGRGR